MSIKPGTRRILSVFLIVAFCNGCAMTPKVPVLMYHEITDGKTPGDQSRISLPRFEVQAHSMAHPWDKDSNLVTWVEGHPGEKPF